MKNVSSGIDSTLARLLEETARRARDLEPFSSVDLGSEMVSCRCRAQPDAAYRIESDDAGLHVTWVSGDRYLSQSIEAELMWTGDDLEEIIEEERIDQGFNRGSFGKLEHFRNEEKLFTFRSSIPMNLESIDPGADAPDLIKCLLAYEAAFRDLGDMKPEAD